MAKDVQIKNTGRLDVVKHRWIYIGISVLFLLPGLYFIIHNMLDPAIGAPVRLGIDFRGGSLIEYGFPKEVTQKDVLIIREAFEKAGYPGAVVQIQEPRVGINKKPAQVGGASEETQPSTQGALQTPAPEAPQPSAVTAGAIAEKTAAPAGTGPVEPAVDAKEPAGIQTIVSIRTKQIKGEDEVGVRNMLAQHFGTPVVLQKNSIGPAMARELLVNGLMALLLAYILIVGYLTFRFQFDFAICAMIALVHDTIFLFGMFALFGQLFHTEVDSLFVTAVLTAVGFSVHDTIVVFDRIRENYRLYFTKKVPFNTIVNMSVNQTLARSINTSLTALLPLIALYFWGGETTRDFVLAIILGITVGTYSSIFVASALLAMWRERQSGGGTPAEATA